MREFLEQHLSDDNDLDRYSKNASNHTNPFSHVFDVVRRLETSITLTKY